MVDGRNMTCVVVTKVKGKGYLEAPKYRLACTAGTSDRLYHHSYLKVMKNATPDSMGLGDTLKRWMYLPLIKEREGQRSTSIVAKHGKVAESDARASWNCKQMLLLQAQIAVQFKVSWWGEPQLHESRE